MQLDHLLDHVGAPEAGCRIGDELDLSRVGGLGEGYGDVAVEAAVCVGHRGRLPDEAVGTAQPREQ